MISVAKRLTDSLQDFFWVQFADHGRRRAATGVKEKNPYNGALRLLTHQGPLLLLPLSYWKGSPLIITNHPPKVVRQSPKDESLTFEGLNEAVEFYSLKGKGNKISYKLNLAKTLPETRTRMCFSSYGWLVIVSHTKGGEWSLVHPFNHAKIELPDVRNLPTMAVKGFHLRKIALSSSPSWTSEYTVMFRSSDIFGFCRPWLGENWKYVRLREDNIRDLSYYEGQFYFVYRSGSISVFDIDKEEIRLVAPEFLKEQLLGPDVLINEHYLVESEGVLLLVYYY